MALKIQIKAFEHLTTDELYAFLQLRSKVFVVEQNCVYQDMDGKDQHALHVLGFKNKKLVAYTRVFKPGDYFEFASIGRVVVEPNQRKFKYGTAIMEASIEAIGIHFKTAKIKISAQKYLLNFYRNLGFKQVGVEYLEDGIPHIAMIRD